MPLRTILCPCLPPTPAPSHARVQSQRARNAGNSSGRPAMVFSDSSTAINQPVHRAFTGAQFIHGGGVAIFHVKSGRVVVVHHTKEGHFFLPKGRKDVGEDSIAGAEREGFEETGFRNRVLPLPHATVQTWPTDRKSRSSPRPSSQFHTEPIATVLSPVGRRNQVQYICSWYIAETLPPALESSLNSQASNQGSSSTPGTDAAAEASVPGPENAVYLRPEPSPRDQTIKERMEMEPQGYEPVSQVRSVMQRDEVDYHAELVPVEEACRRLKGTGLEYVVREGWRMVEERLALEAEWEVEDKGREGKAVI